MDRRWPARDHVKREALDRLLNENVSLSEPARWVRVNRKTAKRRRNGRVIRYRNGRVLEDPSVFNAAPIRVYSSRYLPEEEQIRLADLRREGCTVRRIAVLMGRSPSMISRGLRRGRCTARRSRPFKGHRLALSRRRVGRASRLAGDPELQRWVQERLLQG
jgi:hypothetical protein